MPVNLQNMRAQRYPAAGGGNEHIAFQHALEDVHGRESDEAGDEEVGGAIIKFERSADLLDHALVHDHNAVGHGHGLDLIVGGAIGFDR
ncbi:MAG: hypothetical protein ABS76_06080 [Pelagibacterium sp. SCN 64-44]|nr:MAG: hypothetical protein ABS76_06080 [Pelagibacterium sp. SCN 64-44]